MIDKQYEREKEVIIDILTDVFFALGCALIFIFFVYITLISNFMSWQC